MAVGHHTVAHNDVLARHSPFATVVVASALDCDTVVAGVEDAVFDEDVAAGFRVTAVTVRAVIVYSHAANRQVSAHKRVNNPEWRAQKGDVFNQDSCAAVEIDGLRAKAVSEGIDSLVHRGVSLTPGKKLQT